MSLIFEKKKKKKKKKKSLEVCFNEHYIYLSNTRNVLCLEKLLCNISMSILI